MSLMGIDIAWDKPSVAEIQATGAHFVARYFSHDPTKDLTSGEVTAYEAAGLGIVTVFESTAGRALQGFQAGSEDAHSAVDERQAVGLPASAPIYWAVDTDTTYAAVKAYADGWASVIPKGQSGPYGGFAVVDAARKDGWAYGWQTVAWSNGQWSPLATIKQTGGTVLSGGADIDYAEVPDFGQYPRPEEIVTPQDKADIINGVLKGIPAVIESQPVRDALAGAELWWLDHVLNGTTTPGMDAAQVALIDDMHKALVALNSISKPAPAPAAVSPAL
jgi:hypothetical protein